MLPLNCSFDMEEYHYVRYWKNCLEKNNNSYKFVFALVLLEHIRISNLLTVSYEEIANKFLRFYWDQTVVFKLNQAQKSLGSIETCQSIFEMRFLISSRHFSISLPDGKSP